MTTITTILVITQDAKFHRPMSDACKEDTLADGSDKSSKETKCKIVKYPSNL